MLSKHSAVGRACQPYAPNEFRNTPCQTSAETLVFLMQIIRI